MTINSKNFPAGTNGFPSTGIPAPDSTDRSAGASPREHGRSPEGNCPTQSSSLPEATYKWPDMERDQLAIDLAFEELGENASLQDVVIRAQAIKETLAVSDVALLKKAKAERVQ